MSRIVNAVMATETEKSSPLFQDLFRKEEQIYEIPNIANVYEIGVSLRKQVAVNIFENGQQDSLAVAIQQTKRSIVEAVFGEFREYFYLIDNAINDHDFSKARSLLSEFHQKMFEAD